MSELQSIERKGILVVHRSGLPATPKNPPPVLLLLSGFPDTVQTWDTFAPSFESTHHVVKMAYPDMDASSLRRFWGYTNQEIVDALAVVIQDYRGRLGPDTIIHLMGHDWGSMVVLAYVQRYPDMVTKLITEDVGIISSLTLKQAAVILGYHGFFVVFFLLSRLFGGNDELANTCLHWIIYLYPWPLIGPLAEMLESLPVQPHRCYPYLQQMIHPVPVRFSKTVPQLFLYGETKRCNFHSPEYLQQLEATPGCKHIPYPTAGHWMHVTHAEQVVKHVKEFLKE